MDIYYNGFSDANAENEFDPIIYGNVFTGISQYDYSICMFYKI